MPVNSPLLNRNNQANNGRQAQAQDSNIFELILQEIAAGFKEATIEVAVAVRPLICETNLVHVDTFHEDEEEDPLDYLRGIAASWHNGVKDNLVYWDMETHPDESFTQLFVQYFTTSEKQHKWQVDLNELKQQPFDIADLDSLEDAIQGAHKIKAGEYYNKKGGRNEAHDSEVIQLNQQMQVLTTGYEKLITALIMYFEAKL
ncbi:14836_t:CDS:2 [Cetraspora pellucida]|uniref:14836_t:CDS:1 n=1 Tax=Cetraspora pellucida TaxID=1433469 RepID=A0ACA9NBZ1_9GLOM|nr:14836_t:CDS:2 [Cetraspora pellucida]